MVRNPHGKQLQAVCHKVQFWDPFSFWYLLTIWILHLQALYWNLLMTPSCSVGSTQIGTEKSSREICIISLSGLKSGKCRLTHKYFCIMHSTACVQILVSCGIQASIDPVNCVDVYIYIFCSLDSFHSDTNFTWITSFAFFPDDLTVHTYSVDGAILPRHCLCEHDVRRLTMQQQEGQPDVVMSLVIHYVNCIYSQIMQFKLINYTNWRCTHEHWRQLTLSRQH